MQPTTATGRTTRSTSRCSSIRRAPTSVTLTSPNIGVGGTTEMNTGLTFEVDGVTPGLTVSIFADGGTTPIGSATATDTSVDVVTDVVLTNGQHTFTAEQAYSYSDTVVGNRTISAGELYNAASGSFGPVTVAAAPTAAAKRSDIVKNNTGLTFVVTYSNPGDTITLSSVNSNNILITSAAGFSQLAKEVIAVPNSDGSVVTATYELDAPGGQWDASNLVAYTLTMEEDQVQNSEGIAVAPGVLLVFNPAELTDLTVTINQAAGQADPGLTSPVNFTAVFNRAVTDFSSSGVTITGTAGATTATITPVAADGSAHTVSVTGMTKRRHGHRHSGGGGRSRSVWTTPATPRRAPTTA